jgi:hypothetical protein
MGPDVFSPFSSSCFNASAIVSSVTPSNDTFFFADDNLFKHDLKAKVENSKASYHFLDFTPHIHE